MPEKIKLLICSPNYDDQSEVTSIANNLGSIVYNNLKLDQLDTRSPLRIIETTNGDRQIELWHFNNFNETKMDNLPMICGLNLNGLLIVSNETIAKFLNSNSQLINNRMSILWLSNKQKTNLSDVQLQFSNYNIKQINYTSIESIQTEFNKWFQETYQLQKSYSHNSYSQSSEQNFYQQPNYSINKASSNYRNY